jgi:hypothetical protein
LAIFLMIALPLAWGLGAEYVFERLRRRRARRAARRQEEFLDA